MCLAKMDSAGALLKLVYLCCAGFTIEMDVSVVLARHEEKFRALNIGEIRISKFGDWDKDVEWIWTCRI